MASRTLRFPSDRSVGTFVVVEAGTPKRTQAEAMGDIDVPENGQAILIPDEDGCARPDWASELPPDAFVSIQVPPQVTTFSDETATAFSRFAGLRKLHVPGGSMGDAGLAALGSLRALTDLLLIAPEVTDPAPLGDLVELSSLVLVLPSATTSGLRRLAELTKLTSCVLEIGAVDADVAAGLAGMAQLTRLGLAAPSIAAGALDGLAELPALRSVSVSGPVDDTALSAIAAARGLTSLSLTGAATTPQAWAALRALEALETLAVHQSPLGDDALAHIGALGRLQQFSTDTSDITDAGVAHLAGAVGLTRLVLPNGAVTGRGLAALTGLTELTTVYVPASAATLEGAEALAKLPGLEEVTAEGADVRALVPLLQVRPGVRVNGIEYTEKAVARLART